MTQGQLLYFNLLPGLTGNGTAFAFLKVDIRLLKTVLMAALHPLQINALSFGNPNYPG